MEEGREPSNNIFFERTENAILTDVLRHGQCQDEVRSICEEGLAQDPGEVIRMMLTFQMKLAAARDTNGYTIQDAVVAESK